MVLAHELYHAILEQLRGLNEEQQCDHFAVWFTHNFTFEQLTEGDAKDGANSRNRPRNR